MKKRKKKDGKKPRKKEKTKERKSSCCKECEGCLNGLIERMGSPPLSSCKKAVIHHIEERRKRSQIRNYNKNGSLRMRIHRRGQTKQRPGNDRDEN